MEDDLFKNQGIEVDIITPDNFLKIKETLMRIGINSAKTKTLYQSCHILHKRGRYVIIHFKELFKLDGKPSSITQDDIDRRNLIVSLLEEWGLVKVVFPSELKTKAPVSSVKIIPFRERGEWKLESKYTIGDIK